MNPHLGLTSSALIIFEQLQHFWTSLGTLVT